MHFVAGPTRREACGSTCKLLLRGMVKNTGRVEQLAYRYIGGKAEEYSGKRAWSVIGKQYPEGKAERNQVTSRRSGTREQGNTKRLD